MTAEDNGRERYRSLVVEITDVVGLGDLTVDELAQLAELLIPAHRRVLLNSDRPSRGSRR